MDDSSTDCTAADGTSTILSFGEMKKKANELDRMITHKDSSIKSLKRKRRELNEELESIQDLLNTFQEVKDQDFLAKCNFYRQYILDNYETVTKEVPHIYRLWLSDGKVTSTWGWFFTAEEAFKSLLDLKEYNAYVSRLTYRVIASLWSDKDKSELEKVLELDV